MCTKAQILTMLGLFFEFLSVAYVARAVFPARTQEELGKRWIEQKAKYGSRELEAKAEERRKEWYVVLGLLGFGMLLQGLALFL